MKKRFLQIKSRLPFYGCLSFLALIFIFSPSYSESPLLVFVFTDASPQKVQDDLQGVIGSEVKAFGRIKDLENATEEMTDAPVIAPAVYFEFGEGGYNIILNGYLNDKAGEKFVVVGKDNSITKDKLPDLTAGILDFVGRKNIKDFLTKSFGTSFKRIKRVNKRQDLLTLLGMESVDVIILAESELEKLKGDTKLTLIKISESTKNVNVSPVLASRSGKASFSDKLKAAPKDKIIDLGIDKWGAK